jgi:hypothetical protein
LQYFEAVRMGEEVARRAQVRLAGYAGSAYAAMIVKERAGSLSARRISMLLSGRMRGLTWLCCVTATGM